MALLEDKFIKNCNSIWGLRHSQQIVIIKMRCAMPSEKPFFLGGGGVRGTNYSNMVLSSIIVPGLLVLLKIVRVYKLF